MNLTITNLHPDHFDALARLQYACFPTVAEEEYYRQEHFASHYQIFPDGSFVALVDGRVVGFASGLLVDFDFAQPNHSSVEITGDGMYTTHDPDGAYYYAVDLGVHPDYRGLGIGSQFYNARKALVRRLGKRGIVAGGILADYGAHAHRLSVPAYVEEVVAGRVYDRTLSFQLRNGFQVLGLIENYVSNPVAQNYGTLIYWPNPDHPESPAGIRPVDA